jgi:hypothetical protein
MSHFTRTDQGHSGSVAVVFTPAGCNVNSNTANSTPKSAIRNPQSKIINQKLQMLWVSAFTPAGCNVNSHTANRGQPPTPAGSNVDSKINKL